MRKMFKWELSLYENRKNQCAWQNSVNFFTKKVLLLGKKKCYFFLKELKLWGKKVLISGKKKFLNETDKKVLLFT